MPLLRDAFLFFPLTLAPALFWLVAPFAAARTRTVLASLLLLVAAGLLGDVALFDHSEVRTLDVPNVFLSPETGEFRKWIVARETAPAWAWHVCVSAWFGAFGALIWACRSRTLLPQRPVLLGASLFLAYLCARLALEKCAAPEPIVWATGAVPALVLLLPFLGWHAGRRGYGLGRWTGALAVMAVLQRAPIIVFGYLATTGGWGTHLDTHLVGEMQGLFGPRRFSGDPVDAWTWTTLVPQATLWIANTIGFGLVLGAVPWWYGRRAARAPVA